jgi:hypothetical protein
MSKVLCRIVKLSCALLFSLNLLGQNDLIRQQSCDGNPYQQTVDSLKQLYATQGFTLLREATMSL